jgi:hypothetical protein
MRNWQNHQATTPKEVLKHAKSYPHHNVGVVGKRGIGRHMFLDIDAEGVVERIEQETGEKMPKTYVVYRISSESALEIIETGLEKEGFSIRPTEGQRQTLRRAKGTRLRGRWPVLEQGRGLNQPGRPPTFLFHFLSSHITDEQTDNAMSRSFVSPRRYRLSYLC